MARQPEHIAGGRIMKLHGGAISVSLAEEVQKQRAALEENLSDPQSWLRYAVSLSDCHWLNREAADAVAIAIALNPFDAELHFFRGYCHQKLCLLQEAAADLELAWKLDANHFNAGYYLGQTYYYLGEYERAWLVWNRVMEIAPPDAEWSAVYNWMYLTCRKLNRNDEARAIASRVTAETQPVEAVGTLGNTWTDCQYLLACQMYNGIHTPEQAVAKAEPFGPLNRWYVTLYAALYCDLEGKTEQAVRLYQETVRTFDTIDGKEITKMRTMIQPRLQALTEI